MQWIHDYDLYLFDFDGLLVNTEALHHKAYQSMCQNRGYALGWSFSEYVKLAHTDPRNIRRQIYQDFPGLKESEPHWDVLYKEKTEAYLDLLGRGDVDLMPGAKDIIMELEKRHKTMCVVTNSQMKMVEPVIARNPVLNKIQYWITRDDYQQPKPDPECYRIAIERYLGPGGKAIGFEDSPRGLKALLDSRAEGVWITEIEYVETPHFIEMGARLFPSLHAFLKHQG